jgi:hypothetical protein
MGLEAPEPLEAVEEDFVSLCHAPCVILSGEQSARPRPRGSAWEPPSLNGSGCRLLEPGPWVELKAGKELRVRSRPPSVESLGLGRALGPRVEVQACSGSAFPLSQRVRASAPDGCSP